MVQATFSMLQFWTLGLACLVFGCTTVHESPLGTNTASVTHSSRKTCLETENDIPKAVCCENRLHFGSELSCCGEKAFNPATATCCKVKQGNTIAAHVTEGLSQEVSSCCELKAYNSLNETCCDKTVVPKPGPNAQCCDKEAYDPNKQMCCGPTGSKKMLTRDSSHQLCCGQNWYNCTTHCCCETKHGLHIELINSTCCPNKSALCGGKTYDPDKQMRCGPTGSQKMLTRDSSHQLCCGQNLYNCTTHCCCETNYALHIELINSTCCPNNSALCGGKTYDPDKQMRCGPTGSKKMLTRDSSHQLCCGQNLYNCTTHCCCETNYALHIELINSTCCPNNSALCGGKTYDPDKQMRCGPTGSKKMLTRDSSHQLCCGQNLYNRTTHCCCETNYALHIELINSTCCPNNSGMQQQKPEPRLNCTEPQTSLCGSSCYNPNKFRCCERNQTKCAPVSKCCGRLTYGLAQHRALCHMRTEVDGEECLKISTPYNSVKWTTCCFQLHGHHCCGTEVYQPDTEICCDGHRHPKDEDTHCCGIHAYHSKNQQKCCAGTLYNLTLLGTLGHETQCCGSTLQKAKDVCCIRPLHQQGHHQMIKESRLKSVNSLNETVLCEEMLVGTVEMVSLHCIIFCNVFKIHGRNGSMNPVASPHILHTPDCCNSPEVFPGKTYSFDDVNVFIDFNHDSILQSIHFIMSKCYHR